MKESKRKYEDIIELPHHVSKTHPPMSLEARSAQFAPFAALTGYEEEVKETERLTSQKKEMDEDAKERLDEFLNKLESMLEEQPEVSFTYFTPDKKKEGGSYITVTDFIKKIDKINKTIYLQNGTKIPIKEIIHITSKNI